MSLKMDPISVGDFAEQLMREQTEAGKPASPAALPPVASPIPVQDPRYIKEDPVDISQIEVPTNFLEAVNENKEVTLSIPTVVEDRAEVAEENPVAGQAIDIIIEGLGKMLETVQQTLNEVKEFVNEHSLVSELTTVGMGGVNMAPEKKKKVAVSDEEDDGKEDRLKIILAQVRKDKKKAPK